MIQKLIQQILALLRSGFAGVIANPASRIVAGPAAPETGVTGPLIAVSAGSLTIANTAKERLASGPRPQEIREELAVNAVNPYGPYALAKKPLEKTVLCSVVYDKAGLSERKISLQENRDFTVDYGNPAVLFTYDLSGASVLLLTYSFVGVFTLREFKQDLLLEISDASAANLEKNASLAIAIILTSGAELMEQFNLSDRTEYNVGRFTSRHTIDQIDLREGAPDTAGTMPRLRLVFQVQGQIKQAKALDGGFGIIKKIRSLGRASEYPVDVEVELQ